jgi:hypothetical protein
MKNKIIYMLSADYGGLENWYEAAFESESDRNEIALSIAEEIEWCNFNLNLAAYLEIGMSEYDAWEYALHKRELWEYANRAISTWEVKLYDVAW